MAARGTLHGVGVGPGDPELMTLKAARILAAAPVVVYFARKGGDGIARSIVAGRLGPAAESIRLDYPYTTELATDDPRYGEAMARFYDDAAAGIAAHLDAGRDVAVLCEGDPFFHGSYAHLHRRLAGDYACEAVPGVMAMSGCWARAGLPMTRGRDGLVVLPATMEEDALAARLASSEAAVVMKIGRHLPKVRRALARAALLDRAVYVERGTLPEERIARLADMSDDVAPYFSLVLVPSATGRP